MSVPPWPSATADPPSGDRRAQQHQQQGGRRSRLRSPRGSSGSPSRMPLRQKLQELLPHHADRLALQLLEKKAGGLANAVLPSEGGANLNNSDIGSADAMHVVSSWKRIVRWLEQNAPASAMSLGRPATDNEIRRLRVALGVPVPKPLEAWLRLNNGSTARDELVAIPGGHAIEIAKTSSIFPGGEIFLDCQSIEESRRDFLDFASDIGDEEWWRASWIPITTRYDGHYGLILDSSHGSNFAILEYSESDFARMYATSLSDVLTSLAVTLEEGRSDGAFSRGYRPDVEDQRLVWR